MTAELWALDGDITTAVMGKGWALPLPSIHRLEGWALPSIHRLEVWLLSSHFVVAALTVGLSWTEAENSRLFE